MNIKETYKSRLERLAKQLPESTDGALIISQVNRRYFTGVNIDNGFLFVSRQGSCFVTDFRYIEVASNALNGVCEAKDYGVEGVSFASVAEQLGCHTMCIERESTTLAELDNLKKSLPMIELVGDGALDTIIHSMRVGKSQDELELIKAAQVLTEQAYERTLKLVKEGVSEKELALALEFDIRRNGAESVSFDLIVAAGANGSMPHAVPSDYRIKKGDFITFDIGSTVGGYHSDMTRTVALGEVSEEQRAVYEIVRRAQRAGIDYLMNGGRNCFEADKAARDVIEAAGYGKCFGHSTGHGVGLEIHESPSLSAREKSDIPEGAIVTVEPGIYIEGQFGVRIEDMVYVSENGCIDLTNLTPELVIL